MMGANVIAFVIPGEPQGKGRPRATRINGMVRLYTPSKTANYEGLIAMAAQQAMAGAVPLDGPVMLEVDMVHVMPASWSKKKRAAAGLPTCKPDMDNVIKAVGDGCNGVVWQDDKQIAVILAQRAWGERPEVRVRVAQLEVAKEVQC